MIHKFPFLQLAKCSVHEMFLTSSSFICCNPPDTYDTTAFSGTEKWTIGDTSWPKACILLPTGTWESHRNHFCFYQHEGTLSKNSWLLWYISFRCKYWAWNYYHISTLNVHLEYFVFKRRSLQLFKCLFFILPFLCILVTVYCSAGFY